MKTIIAAIIALTFACAWPTISRDDDWPGTSGAVGSPPVAEATQSDQYKDCLAQAKKYGLKDDEAAGACAAPKANAEPTRAVMFEVTIDRLTGIWIHAQAIGGFPNHEQCVRASAVVAAMIDDQLGPNDIPVFLCPIIKIEGVTKDSTAH